MRRRHNQPGYIHMATMASKYNPESRIVMCGIAKVHIRREDPETPITLVFCRPDDTYAEVTPIKGTPIVQGAGWRARPEFNQAAIASQSWMRARRTLNEAHES